jgi:Predicted hydrolases or acyltransferases (alpha/beta hydrolase superfamily)
MVLLIRSENINNPVLLYLHGGPGDSQIPFAEYATENLTQYFTVVYWDQRGTGLSFSDKIDKNTMTIKQFIEDTESVTQYLKETFSKEKIYLLGHSWGSILGLLAIESKPEYYYSYIGVGQVINNDVLMKNRIEWLSNLIDKSNRNDLAILDAMKKGEMTGFYLVSKYGGLIHNISMDDMGRIMRESSYGKYYTNEVYDKGEKFSELIFSEAKSIDFYKLARKVDIPVYFFLGKYDYVTPTKPVEDFYKVLQAPKKEMIWFTNSGHRMDIEEPIKFQDEIKRVLEK